MKVLILSILMLTSCVSYTPPPSIPDAINQPVELTSFPQKPDFIKYTSKPVVNKIGDNFEVTPELIENSTLMHKYIDKIDAWKEVNKIK